MNRPRKPASHRNADDLAWARALQSAIEALLTGPGVAGRSSPCARIIAVNSTGDRIEIELRFRAGELYCCAEPGCHLSTYSRAWWMRLREALRDFSDRDPPMLSLVVHGILEEGARFKALEPLGSFEVSKAYAYRDGPLRERDAR